MTSPVLVYYPSQIKTEPLSQTLIDGDGDSIFNDIVLVEEEQYLVLSVTEQQYVELLSAAMNGSQDTYPEKFIEVIYPLIKAGKIMLCSAIADCIETSEDVQNAITNQIQNTTLEQISSTAQQNAELELSDGNNPTCDPDKWWSACIQTVQRMNRVNEDGFEILEVNTNIWDAVTNILGNVTGVDESSLDAIASWVQFVIDSIQENYSAQYTTAYEEEVACDLFCLAIDACELTPQMIVNYFGSRLSATINFDTIWYEILNYLVTGTWSGTEIVDFMMASQLAFRAWFDSFFSGISFRDIGVAVKLGFLNPSDDWTVICDTCPDAPIKRLSGFGNADLTTAPLGGAAAMTHNETFDLYRGTYPAGELNAFGDITWTLSEETAVDKVIVQMSLHRTRGTEYNAGILEIDGVNVDEQAIVITPDPVIMTWVYDTPDDITTIRLLFGLGTISSSNGGGDVTSFVIFPTTV